MIPQVLVLPRIRRTQAVTDHARSMHFDRPGYRHYTLFAADQLAETVILPHLFKACSRTARQRGLLGLTRLEPHTALLLPEQIVHMLGMKIPLDLVFVDCHGRVCKVKAHVRPGWRLIGSWRAKHVIELAAGQAATRGLIRGRQLIWHP